MALNLIPLPIAIPFILVFVVAALVVLWKLRKNGKIYRILFYVSIALIVGVIVLALLSVAFTPPPASTGPGPVEIEITTDKLSYLPDEKMHFSVYVHNPQDWAVPYPTGILFEIGTAGSAGSVASYKLTFPAQSKTFLKNFTWSERQPGIYTLTVTLRGDVDYGNPGNLTVNVESPQ